MNAEISQSLRYRQLPWYFFVGKSTLEKGAVGQTSAAAAKFPTPANSGSPSGNVDIFYCALQTGSETTVIADMRLLAEMDLEAVESNWVCFELLGPFAFETIGVIRQISNILADASVSIFVISSYSTDYFLVKADQRETTILALRQHGIERVTAD